MVLLKCNFWSALGLQTV